VLGVRAKMILTLPKEAFLEINDSEHAHVGMNYLTAERPYVKL
jgi:hypothetical protein